MEGGAVGHNLEMGLPKDYPCQGMVLGWALFKIVSDSPALHSRWQLLLKIEMSSIVHCCFSIIQNEPQILTAATWQ
jgi:hypothetical protein